MEITELAKALNEFQAELVTVGKNSDNPFFKSKYADLADIMKQAQPVLTKHGLSVVQLPDNIEGKPALTTYLLHKSGQSVKATVPLTLAKEDPQGVGSAITYMRRYGYAAALQIVIDEDDDGNKATYTTAKTHTVTKQTEAFTAPLKGEASDKQKKTIHENLSRLGITDEDQKGYLIENWGVKLPLSKADASMIIEDLFEGNSYARKEYDDAKSLSHIA